MMKRLISMMFGLWLLSVGGYAQSISRFVIHSTGVVSQGDGHTLSSSVGEIAVNYFETTTYTIAEGFQQASIKPLVKNEEEDFVTIAPNPITTPNKLKIKFLLNNFSYNIDVYTLSGSKIASYPNFNVNVSGIFFLDISGYSNGLYMVHVYSHSGELNRMFKIVKY